MTMNFERRNAVNRARKFLLQILEQPEEFPNDVWQEARSCLKHYPSDYDMERAAEQTPEIFGDWEYYRNEK